MKRSISLVSLLSILSLGAADGLRAQNVYSQSLPSVSGNAMTITIKIRQGTPNTIHAVTISGGSTISLTGPASVGTDAVGYGCMVLKATGSQANCAPEKFTVTITGAGSKEFLLKCANSQMGSAWPEFLQVEGAFCNPAGFEAAHLQVSRATDLDGDGIYGDVIVENNPLGLDDIDFPGEFSMDVNTQGFNGCVGGVAPGVFQPGSPTRQVTFMADNRSVTGTCNFTTQMNFLQDISFGQFNGQPTVFATSSSADTVLIARDNDNNGSLTAAEITTFFDPTVLVSAVDNFSPDGVAVDPTAGNRVYWISDKSPAPQLPDNQGLYRLTDADASNTIAAGEFVASWVAAGTAVSVEAQAIDPTEFECVHCDGVGGVLVNQTALGTIFYWLDANANGVAETGEVTNWLTYNTASTLTVSHEFLNTSGFPTFAGPYYGMNLIESVRVQGNEIYFVASTSSSGGDAGFIFRCRDLNGDNDVNDQGEVTVFNDPALILGEPFPPNWHTGMDAATVDVNGNGVIEPSEIFVYGANPNGPRPNCGFSQFNDQQNWRFNDNNGDGDASDPGEHKRVSIHPTGAFNRGLEVIPGPLDGGFRHTFNARSGLLTIEKGACVTSIGQSLEVDFLRHKLEEGTQGTPFATNTRFTLVSRGNPSTGGPNSGLLLAALPLVPPFFLGPCNIGINPIPISIALPAVVPDANGVASFPFPIAVPIGTSASVYVQPYNLTFPSLFLGETAELRIN